MKTVCVYHSIDLDGLMSAAIVKYWFTKEVENKMTEDNIWDSIYFIGYNYGQPIPDLSKYDEVIMCDISFPESEMYKLCITKDFIWNDHHASALAMYENIRPSLPNYIYYAKGLRGVQYAACELTWMYFFPNETMPEIVRLLGRYDCFGHKGTDEEQKVLEFQYGARSVISNYEEAYNLLISSLEGDEKEDISTIFHKGKAIYQYLCTEAKQTYEKAFPIKFGVMTDNQMNEKDFDFISGATYFKWKQFLCVNQERFNPINFGIDYHKDGYDGFACFWYKDNKWHFSLYNDNGEIDCSIIAKQYGGGGHKGAAGFVVDDLNAIIK